MGPPLPRQWGRGRRRRGARTVAAYPLQRLSVRVAGRQAKNEEQCPVNLLEFCWSDSVVGAQHPALIDGANLIHQRPGFTDETARSGPNPWVQGSHPRCTGDWDDYDEWEPLVIRGDRIADHHAGADTSLFMSNGWVKFDEDDGTARQGHS